MLREWPHTKSFTSLAPHSATGWKILEEEERTEVAPRTWNGCKKLSYRLTPQPNQKTPATLKHSPSLFKKTIPKPGRNARELRLVACWPARRNERTSERTDERTAWTEPERRKQNTGARETESAIVQQAKQSNEYASDSNTTEWDCEWWVSERVVPPKPQTDDEEWREVTEAAKTRRDANDGLSGGLQKRERGRGVAGVRGRERASDGGKNAWSGNIDSTRLAMAGSYSNRTEPNQTKRKGTKRKIERKGKER